MTSTEREHDGRESAESPVESTVESTTESSGSPSIVARPLIGGVKLYQMAAAGRPSPCRHVPSCSTYAVEALETHGAARGSWLAARRLLRCNPWGTEGYDPVPERPERSERKVS